ncbi:hypothetical protein HanIR_Chr14g0699511 [Helianthus annuus]|nr:hypothetical protein HanIR_Chr14g0699511 [Helianthus annuus]
MIYAGVNQFLMLTKYGVLLFAQFNYVHIFHALTFIGFLPQRLDFKVSILIIMLQNISHSHGL